jgi:hypothetical protein
MSTIAPPRPSSRRNGRTNHASRARGARIAAYTDDHSRRRELVRLTGAAATTLVIDRIADLPADGDDARLVAHLAADEPAENARTVARLYLAGANARRCRSLTPADLRLAFGEGAASEEPAHATDTPASQNGASATARLLDSSGNVYRLAPSAGSLSIPELRWCRTPVDGAAPEPVSVRSVIGALESYEPALGLTRAAVRRHADDARLSVAVLRLEYQRATTSPIVLNRGLRDAVQRQIATGDVTMSEIAIRCGRVRHGERGSVSGETSWLARRVGLVAEAGHAQPTPWVHTDVLALISRALCVSPREVEV